MAVRDIWIHQEGANGKFGRVLLSPAAAKGSLSLNGSGVPVATTASAAVPDSAATQATAIDTSNMDDGSADNVLIGLDTATGVYTVAEASNIEKNFDKISDEINTLKTLTDELQTKLNSALAVLRAHNLLS